MPKKHHAVKRNWGPTARRQYHRTISRAICRATKNPAIPVDPAILDRISMVKGIDRRELESTIRKRGFNIGEKIKLEPDLDLDRIFDLILLTKEPLIRANLLSKVHKMIIYKYRRGLPIQKDLGNARALLELLKNKHKKPKSEQLCIQRLDSLLVYLESQTR